MVSSHLVTAEVVTLGSKAPLGNAKNHLQAVEPPPAKTYPAPDYSLALLQQLPPGKQKAACNAIAAFKRRQWDTVDSLWNRNSGEYLIATFGEFIAELALAADQPTVVKLALKCDIAPPGDGPDGDGDPCVPSAPPDDTGAAPPVAECIGRVWQGGFNGATEAARLSARIGASLLGHLAGAALAVAFVFGGMVRRQPLWLTGSLSKRAGVRLGHHKLRPRNHIPPAGRFYFMPKIGIPGGFGLVETKKEKKQKKSRGREYSAETEKKLSSESS